MQNNGFFKFCFSGGEREREMEMEKEVEEREREGRESEWVVLSSVAL